MESVIKISSGASKWDIRDKVWDYIEDNNLANFPRPVHNRIPNFKGAAQACDRLAILQEFKSAQTVKINPDRPQQQARFITLDARKTLLVPTPRLRSGLFNKITPPQGATKQDLRVCASSQGVKEFSVPVGLDAKVKVDLLVVGSVAVSEKGYRIGKGEGFADMEYGMMVSMGAVDQSTVVVTVVHDCQVVDIEEELIENHDLTVDYILTPTRMIKTDCQRPKPPGIIWSKLNTDMLQKIPILKKLRDLEQQAGKDVTLGTAPSEGTSPTQRKEARPQARRRPRRDMPQDAEGEPRWARRQENTEVSEQRPRQARVRKDGRDGKDSRGEGRGNRGGEGREGVKGEGREVGKGKSRDGDRERRERTGEEGGGEAVTTVYLGGLPAGLRVSELKVALREREAVPLRLAWQGAQHRAFLDYCDLQAAETALMALQGLSLNGHSLQAEMAKRQRGGRWSGQANRRPKPAAAPRSKIRPPESSSETQAKDQQPSKA